MFWVRDRVYSDAQLQAIAELAKANDLWIYYDAVYMDLDFEKNKTLAIYPYRLIAMEKNEDEFKAVSALQKNLRAMQARQIKSAKFTPVAPAE